MRTLRISSPRGAVRRLTVAFALVAVVAARAIGAQEDTIPGYMRVDADALGTQIWFGAVHPLWGMEVNSDIYLLGTTAELDVGPAFAVGENLTLLPMAGVMLDFAATRLTTVVPQLYLYWGSGPLYLESWEVLYLELQAANTSTFNDRTFLLYSVADALAMGPQVELWYDVEKVAGRDRLSSLALGGRANLAYGAGNTLGLFLGYETVDRARSGGDGVVGRFTFIREW